MRKENGHKQKSQTKQFVFDKKIRDIKLNEKQHFSIFIFMLVIFNFILIASVWFVLCNIYAWYYWVICLSLLVLCFWLSLKTFREQKVFYKVTIYSNGLSMNSIWINLEIPFENIIHLTVKKSWLDKFFKQNTNSLIIHFNNNGKKQKIAIHFIEEDATNLSKKISKLIEKYTNQKPNE